ncbi:MAG: type II toxin-antitoxin system Phd/YefM family antitoxin [Opitutaceae bacterium]|jgi:antitoxin StbD|nr:type II toxin-antitoxin system Phd/YefM family antitoxin [Opitutaceae bacterium]
MSPILSPLSASISELKKNPSQLIERAGGETVAILNHNKPTAYLVPAEAYEWISELIEDQELRDLIQQREQEKSSALEVSLDEL